MHSKLLHSSKSTLQVADSSNQRIRPVASSHQQQYDRLQDVPLNARVPLAIMRLSSHGSALPIPHRHVIDVLSRILDPGPERAHRVASLNTWNEVVLARTCRPLRIARSPSTIVSDDEALLIDALTRAQDFNLDDDDYALSSIMERSERIRFRDAGRHMMAGTAMHPTRTIPNWQRQPSVLECEHLCLAESIVLNMLRLWVRSKAQSLDSTIAVSLMSEHLGVPHLGELICSLLSRISHSAYRKFDACCICCPEISPDEASVLDGLSAIEFGSHSRYMNSLLQWIPTVWAQAVFNKTIEHAQLLPETGISLPRRDWAFATLVARQPLFRATAQEHRTVH